MDEEDHLQPVLLSQEENSFRTLNTIFIISVPLLFGFTLEITGIVFLSSWYEGHNKCDTFFIFLYLHCVYWLIIMLTDYVINLNHQTLRTCGYLDFYESTHQYIHKPLSVSSMWNTLYLLLAVILQHIHETDYEDYCRSSERLTPVSYILFLTTFELMFIVPVYINYIKCVRRFNHMKPLPDVMREEWLSAFNHDSYAGSSEVGHHRRESKLSELLEKQADLIRYLRDHNSILSHHVISLTSQTRTEA